MSDFYDAESEPDYFKALQRRINDGSIWSFVGSAAMAAMAGRAAMAAIEGGHCVLGREQRKDYWGSTIPSRYDVKPGTHGSVAYAREIHGDKWARSIARVR